MSIVGLTMKNQMLMVVFSLLILAGGWLAFTSMPRFEDPEFTIRTAQIFTMYPGADPRAVADEVTTPLEKAIQEMQEVEEIRSVSSDGVSEISVDIKYEFSKSKSELNLIWAKLRNKVKDAESSLPPNVLTPMVNDDFGDVYGLYYYVTGEGYTMAELRAYVKELQKELLQVEGVAKVAFIGDQKEAIFVEISRENAANLGLNMSTLFKQLSQQNAMVASGDLKAGDYRLVIDPSGQIDSVKSIQNLLVSASDDKPVYLKDIAKVYRGYQDPPLRVIRYNEEPAIALGVSNVSGGNVVEIGNAIDAKLKASENRRPHGIEIHEFYHQGNIVDESIRGFALNVVAALVIVIVTLLIFMGPSSAAVIGAVLLMTVFATLATMDLMGIPMHRISLGALIIALGMMVDNAIVVTEGILVGVKAGRKKLEIAKEVVSNTKWPLLGGTLVGIVAFAPIGFAPGSTAEYTGDLFWVVMISLLFSWLFAITLTPMFCLWLFREKDGPVEEHEPGKLTKSYMGFMNIMLRMRFLVIAVVLAMFGTAIWGWQFVKSGFFPSSTTPQVVVDYWLPQGTDISRTLSDVKELEDFAETLREEGVTDIQSSVGSGVLRFMLTYDGESPNGAYAQLLLKVDDYNKIDALMPKIQSFADEQFPDAQTKVWRFVLGPGGGSKVEATFKGPEPEVLSDLADQAKRIMVDDGGALSIKDDWRQPVMVLVPKFNENKASRAGVSREDLSTAINTAFSGSTVGTYREGDDLISIIARAPYHERDHIDDLYNIQVLSSGTGKYVPIAEVTEGFETQWRYGMLQKQNQQWVIKAQSDPMPGELAADLMKRIQPKIEAIPLPPGYTLEWDGEAGNSAESQADLASVIPFGVLAMILIVLILFGKIRQTVVVFMIVPLCIIGVAVGLILTGLPLEFMAILGLLSLSGLLIKNAIVLVDEIDLKIKEGLPRYDAVVVSATSRVRPVMMGTLTTVLGVLPLYSDIFFKAMSVTLVFGLLFATLLTLILVPILYAVFFNIKAEETKVEA